MSLAKVTLVGLRVQPGDDASCLNLYQPTQPRAIGLPQRFVDHGGFAWSGSLAETPQEKQNPWMLLNRASTDAVPVVLDANTATYSLHKGLGDVLDLTDGRSQPMKVQIVGLLRNSIFQGDMLMSEANLLAHFPDVNGYRMFLIESPDETVTAVQATLETAMGDYGFDAERTADRLADYFAVQNTYLSTFQSLGGLGLLLGTFGLAAVQLRSMLERRGELALLRAVGFAEERLRRLVILENAVLLVGGLAVGVTCALVAVLPHWLGGDATVPWRSLALTLLLVLTVGVTAGALAARMALRGPVLSALRGD
jgi:ABC-type antimicrobial peptide transport system permease subunit